MIALIVILVAVGAAGLILLAMSLHDVQQYEKGVVFRFGRLLPQIRGPGLRLIRPIGDRMRKVSVQTQVMGIPAQGAITADNVTLTVDAVVYFRVIDPVKALVNVRDYPSAVSQIAQTSLRSVIGRADLDTLLSDRDHVNAELKKVMDAPTEEPWGLRIERVEIKDIALPPSMMRSMSKQAEAERERRARVIAADGEFQASQRLTDAAATMADTPGALQLRLLQTVVDVAAEKNSTLVMPFPVELLRFFEHHDGQGKGDSARRDSAAPLSAGLDGVRLDGAGEPDPPAASSEADTTPTPGRVPTAAPAGPAGPAESGNGSIGVSLRSNANASTNGHATRARLARERRENRPTPRPAGDDPSD